MKTTVTALRDAMTEARATTARHADHRVITPLFVRNADPSPRLDAFGQEFIDTLTHSADRSEDVRTRCFPQAEQTRGEAALVVGGFTDADARRHVADLYVWGFYRELPANGAAFAETPVEIDLTLWDGTSAPRHLIDRVTVAELPALARRMAGPSLDAARQSLDRTAPPSSEAEGRSVAGLLREQGERLAAVIEGYGTQRDAFLNTAEGRDTTLRARLLLETACFFGPDDRAAARSRLRLQWGGFPLPTYGLPLLDAWRCADEVVSVVERFEAAGDNSEDWRPATSTAR